MHITEKQFETILALIEHLGPKVKRIIIEGQRVTLETTATSWPQPYPNPVQPWRPYWQPSTTTNPGTITVHADGTTVED